VLTGEYDPLCVFYMKYVRRQIVMFSVNIVSAASATSFIRKSRDSSNFNYCIKNPDHFLSANCSYFAVRSSAA